MLDIKLLRIGRHFRLPSGAKVIVGRDEEENRLLLNSRRDGDLIFEVVDFVGPVTVLRKSKKPIDGEDIQTAAALCVRYSDYKNPEPAAVSAGESETVWAAPLADELVAHLRIV